MERKVQRSRRSFTRENARGHGGPSVAFSETPTPTYIVVGTGGLVGKVSRRFPSRTVTLFAPDDSYLGTRKFMGSSRTQVHTSQAQSPRSLSSLGFAYDESINRNCARFKSFRCLRCARVGLVRFG